MSNYKETAVAGESYQRSHRIIVENKKHDVPHITFQEETLMTVNGAEIHTPAGQLTIYFDQAGMFDLFNPVTDAPMGNQGTHEQLQILLYSLYKYEAAKRDAAIAASGG